MAIIWCDNGNWYGRAADAGMCTDAGTHVAVCEAHGAIVSADDVGMVRHAAENPAEFCDGCRDGNDNETTGR